MPDAISRCIYGDLRDLSLLSTPRQTPGYVRRRSGPVPVVWSGDGVPCRVRLAASPVVLGGSRSPQPRVAKPRTAPRSWMTSSTRSRSRRRRSARGGAPPRRRGGPRLLSRSSPSCWASAAARRCCCRWSWPSWLALEARWAADPHPAARRVGGGRAVGPARRSLGDGDGGHTRGGPRRGAHGLDVRFRPVGVPAETIPRVKDATVYIKVTRRQGEVLRHRLRHPLRGQYRS